MDTEKEIPATQIGRWNTIKHPRTGEWVKTTRVLRAVGGVNSTRPGASHEHEHIHITLEGGEELELDGTDKVIRKE